MRVWQTIATSLERHGRCALVTLVEAKGSVPREPGVRLIVIPDQGFHGTIGGGTLEWQALAQAQEDLQGSRSAIRFRDYPLGPSLGQCCGGHATLAFEVLEPEDREAARALAAREAAGRFRTIMRPRSQREVYEGDLSPTPPATVMRDGDHALIELFGDDSRTVLLFGAGHVGRALMLALAPLPFRLLWADSRSDAFPAVLPDAVETRCANDPAELLRTAPAEAFVLVMTHSHALDQEVVDAALRDGRFGYVGLIGSATKRARFEKRMTEAGLPAARLSDLTCPIGVAGVESKEPAAIAAAVAAELLIRDSALRKKTKNAVEGGKVAGVAP